MVHFKIINNQIVVENPPIIPELWLPYGSQHVIKFIEQLLEQVTPWYLELFNRSPWLPNTVIFSFRGTCMGFSGAG